MKSITTLKFSSNLKFFKIKEDRKLFYLQYSIKKTLFEQILSQAKKLFK